MPASSSMARPTTSIPSGGLFSPYAETKIRAPASAIFDAIVHVAAWPAWNTFVPQVTITKQPGGDESDHRLLNGSHMTLHVKMTDGFTTKSQEVVSIYEQPPKDASVRPGDVFRVCWVFANSALVPRFVLQAERVNEIEVIEEGLCLYRTWETFGGPAAKLVKWRFEQVLQQRFREWTSDLKAHLESQ